jgi:hypothetical protein
MLIGGRAFVAMVALTLSAACAVPLLGVAQANGRKLRPVYTAPMWRCPVTVAELRARFAPTTSAVPTSVKQQCAFFDSERFAAFRATEYAGDRVAALRSESAGEHKGQGCRFGAGSTGKRGFSMSCDSKDGAFYTAVFMPDRHRTWIVAAAYPTSEPVSARLRAIVTRLLVTG